VVLPKTIEQIKNAFKDPKVLNYAIEFFTVYYEFIMPHETKIMAQMY